MASSVCLPQFLGSSSSSLFSCHGFREADGFWRPWPSARRTRSSRSTTPYKDSGSVDPCSAASHFLQCTDHSTSSNHSFKNRTPSCNAIGASSFGLQRHRPLRPASALPPAAEKGFSDGGKLPQKNLPEESSQWNGAMAVSEALPPEGATLLLSCVVGLATGVIVVGFNKGVSSRLVQS